MRGAIAVATYVLGLSLKTGRRPGRASPLARRWPAMVVFGVLFSLAAFWATRGATPRPVG